MPTFPSNPLKSNPVHRVLRKYPALFGVPFVIIIVGASYAMQTFTQTRYDLHDKKVTQVRPHSPLVPSTHKAPYSDASQPAGEQGAGARARREPEEVRHPGGVLRASLPSCASCLAFTEAPPDSV